MTTQSGISSGSPESIPRLLLGILIHLNRRRRRQLVLLFVVMLASGGAEMLSLGAVLPFLAVLSNPDRLWQQPLVQALASEVGFKQAGDLLLPVTLAFAVAALLAALVRLTNLWLNGRLAAAIGSDLSCEAYRRTLYQTYEVHLQRNSAAVITATTNHTRQTVDALNALLQLTTSSLVTIGLLIALILIDAPVAVATASLLGSAYGVLAITSKRELRRNGQNISAALGKQLKALQEGLGSIRDVLLDHSQATYLQIYRQADLRQRQLQARNAFIGAFPRYALEALGITAIAIMGSLLVFQRGSGTEVIPLLGVLALGAQRLLPALQQIYSGWALMKGYNAAINDVLAMLNQPMPIVVNVVKPLLLLDSIRLKAVHFRYVPEQPEVLRGLDLEIRRGETIGLIGSTGSGKSTTADLLMGLLVPTSGLVLIDGKNLHDPAAPERLAAWRLAIAHVPQNVYLADSSFAENIAFGVPRENIDIVRVQQAAMKAQIDSFVESSSEGYDTFVGERGIRLSGGQLQRIGIARALYKNAQVLVFDEASSALDSNTERALMDAINQLSKELTIIMIAHRLSTVKRCDRVIRLADGSVEADGLPDFVIMDS